MIKEQFIKQQTNEYPVMGYSFVYVAQQTQGTGAVRCALLKWRENELFVCLINWNLQKKDLICLDTRH